jgi:XTP/dITP diphosphohydrolase
LHLPLAQLSATLAKGFHGRNGLGYSRPVQILFATTSRGKVQEIRRLFPGDEVLLPADLGIAFDHEETGTTYLDNALGKARALFEQAGRPVMADDSGLSVPALGGEPGVLSARYGSKPGGPRLSDSDRNQYLLDRMRDVSDRRAFFVCCLVYLVEPYRFVIAQETVSGVIAHEPAGSGGFGYDPLFHVFERGATIAQLSDEDKDRISHRGRAASRLTPALEALRP